MRGPFPGFHWPPSGGQETWLTQDLSHTSLHYDLEQVLPDLSPGYFTVNEVVRFLHSAMHSAVVF